jgi:urease accessory protein
VILHRCLPTVGVSDPVDRLLCTRRHPSSSITTTASFLVLGVLTAADAKLSPRLVSILALSAGCLHGWLNGASLAQAGREPLGLLGIGASTFVIVALMAALVVSLRLAWMRIAVRVAGSWVAAIGLLMLGWSLR